MNRIKELISSAGITSKELSKQTGIPYDSLKNYEYGRREPTGKALAALEQYFNVSGAYILGDNNDESDLLSWQDPVIMNAITDNIKYLLNGVITAAESSTDEEKKILFDILVELKSLTNSDSQNKRENLIFILESIKNSDQFIQAIINANNDEK